MKEIKETIEVLKELLADSEYNVKMTDDDDFKKEVKSLKLAINILENLDEDKIKEIFRQNHSVVFDCVCIRESEWNAVIKAILKRIKEN